MGGITDPAEEYFKDGVWGWDSAAEAWKKLEATPSGYLPVVAPGGDRLFSVEDVIVDKKVTTNASAGWNVLDHTAVPSGKLWVVTNIVATNESSAIARITLRLMRNSTVANINILLLPAIYDACTYQGYMVLEEEDKISTGFSVCVAGDTLRSHVLAFQMDAPS